MKVKAARLSLISGLFAILLPAFFVAGCGGGSTEGVSPSNPNSKIDSQVTADAGLIVAVKVGQIAELNGSNSSTTLSAPLSYAWSFNSKPDTSKAVLQNANTATPSFTADVVGTYVVQLVVTAGGVSSQRALGFVEVSNLGDNYTGLHLHIGSSYTSACSNCHDGRFANDPPPFTVGAKSGNHMATSNQCEACHTTFGFYLPRAVDHQEVYGTCSSCHNGIVAVGKSVFHVVTSAECSDCHTTTSFVQVAADGSFDHTGISTGCSRCHNGTIAIGKDADPTPPHPDTLSDCSYCHTTTSFKNAYPDHTGPDVVGKRCDSCHNSSGGGFNASDEPVGHPVMAYDCGACHSINGFSMGGVFNHRLVDPVVQPCSVCHDGNNSINAIGMITGHVPTNGSDCAMCHTVTSFKGASFDHTGVVNNCGTSGCHDPASVEGSYAAGPNHIASNGNDCENCHTPGTFTTGFYNHSGVTNGCTACHNDVITAGKPFDHIPTTPDNQDCVDCHGTKFDDFTGAVFTHTGITSGCVACHDGSIASGKSPNHMPTTPNNRDCVDCHVASLSTFTDFKGGIFTHDAGVNNNCATCHDGVIAMAKKIKHIPAQQECSQCHIDTTVPGGFALTTFYTNLHPDLLTGCEGCHKSQFFPDTNTPPVTKLATHLPTMQDCHFCHTNEIPGGFSPAMSIFNHTGITGNCASCHDGSANNVAAGAVGKTPSPPHPVTTEDCGVCHGVNGTFADAAFDHTGRVDNCNECHYNGTATKKPANHLPTVPIDQDCSVCHVPGSFKTAVFNHTGIVDNCSSCHDGTVATATTKSTNHIPVPIDTTTGKEQDCSVCHNTTAFAGARFDHTGTTGACAVCHDGIIALGKNGTHVPTSEDCNVCHLTAGFIPGTFAHTSNQIAGKRCDSCHDGIFATGKVDAPTPHPTTVEDCGSCHTTGQPFSAPVVVDHTGITSGCNAAGCHEPNGAGRYYNTATHINTSEDCVACHAVDGAFLDGTFTHPADAAGRCMDCHISGGIGTPQPANGPNGHFDTNNVQCDACHVTTTWFNTSVFDHCPGTTANNNACAITTTNPNGKYPGDHRAGKTTCLSCHKSNSTVVTYSTPFDTANPPHQLSPDCAGCHRNRFRSVDKHIGGKSGTVYQNRNCASSGCHRVSSDHFN